MENQHKDQPESAQEATCAHPCASIECRRIDQRVARFFADHPLACLAGALGVGLLVARLTQDRS